MANSTDYLLSVEGLTRVVRRLQGRRRPVPLRRQGELRVIIGPNGAGKTTVLDLISGRTRATAAHPVQGPEITGLQGARDRPRRHRPQVPDAVDLRKPHGVREPRDVVSARPQRVRARWFCSAPRGRRAASRRSAATSSCRPPRSAGRDARATARSSGWRSGCC